MRGNSTAGLAVPLEPRFIPAVVGSARSYLRLYGVPRRVERFIVERIRAAAGRLTRSPRAAPVRIRLSLRSRSGKIRVALRVGRDPAAAKRIAPLARGSPGSVRASFQSSRTGGTLAFTADRPGDG